mgnify:CR=1 FL=1
MVAVARAIVGKPLILLADEPTGNLDSKNGHAVMELMKELHDEGATICMVTHDPRYAHHAKRAVNLFDGQVVEEKNGEKVTQLEESGFEVEIERLLDVYYYEDYRGSGILVLYQGKITDGRAHPGDDALEVGLFGPDELPEDIAFDFIIGFVQAF